jgi:nucleotide-binding universal stress UspA family protein
MKPMISEAHLDRFDSLVVACDFTAISDRMLPIVGGLARRGDLPVQLVTTASPGLEEYDLNDLALRAERIHGCPVTAHVTDGDDPADDIAQFAGRHPGALLCLGSHGRTALGKALLGSMTEDLLRRHVGPVLAVGPGVPDDYEVGGKLLVAVDSHSLRTALLDVARAWLTTFGGTVELFEAVTRSSASAPIQASPELHAAQQAIPSAVVSVVDSHDPVRAILDAATRSGSVVAVSSHVRTGLERAVLGSVGGELLRFSSAPVLIVTG